MRLSNKSTFSLACLILLFVFAAMPAMAQTIEAEWAADVDDVTAGNQAGWDVTIGGLSGGNTPAVTFLDPNGTAAATGTGVGTFTAATATVSTSTGTILAGVGDVIAVQVVVGTSTYQRVTFPAGGPNAMVPSTDLTLIPMLKELTTSEYYISFGEEKTITFDFADAVDGTNGDPVAPLHVSDVTVANAGLQVVSVSGTDQVKVRSSSAADATSDNTGTVVLDAVYALPATTVADGQAEVTYDNTAPTITDGTITVAAPPGSPTPPDGVWGGAFPVFNLTFSVSDEATGSDLPDVNPVKVVTDTDKLEVVAIGLGVQADPPAGTEYLVQIRPKTDRATTAGEPVTITVIPVDNAGNEGSGAVSVKLAASTPPDAVFSLADPASGNVMQGGTITVTFDKDPGTVVVDVGTVAGTGNTRTITVPANQAAGAFQIALTWGQNGRQVLSYTLVIPDAPAVTFSSAVPDGGNIVAGNSITLTFANDPGTVTASVGTITGTGNTRTLTIPAGQAAGEVEITVSWTKAGHEAGSTMLTYTVTRPFVSANPTNPVNISAPIEIPANSYVILVRDMDSVAAGLTFPMVDGNPVIKREWADMPDLEALFNRSSYGQGGALVLRRSADARDNDMQDDDGNWVGRLATPSLGSVGISEIMWALDLGLTNRDSQPDVQWIELHNLNNKPVKVLIYAQTARDLVSGGLVGNTAAGDSIIGDLGGMVVDAVTNIRNKGDQHVSGWDVPGDNGNSVTGDDFTAMHRILPHNQPAYTAAQNYTKRNGRDKDVWKASPNAYAVERTDQPASATTNVVAITNYKGTPGQRNDYTGVSLHTRAERTNLNDALPVVFNEIGNRSDADKDYEWIELRNRTGSPQNLQAYIITMLRQRTSDANATDQETILYRFPHNQAATVPANGVLLLVATDPALDDDHPLAIGYNIDKNVEDQIPGFKGAHVPRYKVTPFAGNGIPNGNFVLVLRKPDNRANNDISETGRNDFDKIVDMAGYANLTAKTYPNPVSETGLWPLDAFPAPNSHNNLTENKVHRREEDSDNKDHDRFGTGRLNNADNQPMFRDAGFTGIGYRRDVSRDDIHGGDPGYHKPQVESAAGIAGDVVISELMLSIGNSPSRRLPQWIEITNNSGTKTVDLDAGNGWSLVIETPGDDIRSLNFKAQGQVKYIYPKQTILIVAGSPTRNAQVGSDLLRTDIIFKSDRVFNVLREYGTNFSEFEVDGERVKNDRYRFLNPKHFHIALKDGSGNTADVVGNLDGRARTNDEAAWDYPNGLTKEGDRTSFIRLFDEGNARSAVGSDAVDVLPLGAVRNDAVEEGSIDLNDYDSVIPAKYAWIQAAALNFDTIYVRHTWYGSEDDYGTPGAVKGQVLPVQLSAFRPALENGEIVIRWTTESELDNAGFNIYRSDTRDGEFKQVNAEMIQGHGTTGERHTYKWIDTSAKPDTVYYYQIEDVSFAGERQTLMTTKLRGFVSAKNKLATRWGELKEIQ